MASPARRRFVVLCVVLLGLLGLCAAVVPASADAAVNCGGTKIAKPGGGNWTCSWDEEFNTPYLNLNNWTVQTSQNSGRTAGQACLVNTARNVYVNGGSLNLVARKEAAPFACPMPSGHSFTTQYTGAEVFTYSKFSQLYGRFEIRAAFPAAKVAGLQQALWMWPNNSTKYGAWPKSGEIDIAETSSLYADRVIPFIHYESGDDPNVTNNYCMISNRNQMHRYTLTWTPTNMTIQYDGRTCISDKLPSNGIPFNQPFFMALTAGLGVAPNYFTPGKTPLPAVTRIDYVRVWK